MTDKTYTEVEVDSIRTEERFITYLVLSSVGMKLRDQPVQYREARANVEAIVNKSPNYDDTTKEKFGYALVMLDNCIPAQERPKAIFEVYNTVIKDILAPSKKDTISESQ